MPNKLTSLLRWRAAPVVIATTMLLLAGCGQGESLDSASSDQKCVAESIKTLHRRESVPSCNADGLVCRVKCLAGDAGACLGMAYDAEKNRDPKAESLYARSCILGEANACTNYAAHMWTGDRSDEQLPCARRTFEMACAAKEPYACGMVGRIMLESTVPVPYDDARKHLEATCESLGGFPCRVLARHLESGKLGTFPPDRVRSLLTRACSGGDLDACGNPRSAAETFK